MDGAGIQVGKDLRGVVGLMPVVNWCAQCAHEEGVDEQRAVTHC